MYKVRSTQGACLASFLFFASACGDSPAKTADIPDASWSDDDAGADAMTKGENGACDASGIFVLRMATYSQFVVESVTSALFYLEIEQDGDLLTVKKSVDCGYTSIAGGMSAHTSPAADATLAEHNNQAGRTGFMRKAGEYCDFRLNRIFSVRGVSPEVFLPDGPFADYDLAHLKERMPLPTLTSMSEAIEDWDNDGHPGLTVFIGNNAERYGIARDWTEYFSCNGTDADSPVCGEEDVKKYALRADSNLDEFTVRTDFEGEDVPLGASSSLYSGVSMPLRIADNRATFKRIGRTLDDPLPKKFWSEPTASARCAMLRELLPPERN